MPRVMDLTDELQVLTEQLKDDPNHRLTRQYVLRLPLAYAINFICDCIDQEKQPAHLLRDIVEDHYDSINNEQINLNEYSTKVVNTLVRHTKQNPSDVVNSLLLAIGPDYLASLKNVEVAAAAK